jgi:hypothetical protein
MFRLFHLWEKIPSRLPKKNGFELRERSGAGCWEPGLG